MKSKKRQRMDDLVAQRIKRLQEPQNAGMTGKESLQAILGLEAESPPEPEKKQIVLYLRDRLKGVDRNFTKYPNSVHDMMREKLQEEAEGVLYMYLWRQSWGYGRNYCRIGYSNITKLTMIRARNTARRAMANLVAKQFAIRALDEQGKPNITQKGTLYRILTPDEISNGITEEGHLLKDIPLAGVPILSMPEVEADNNPVRNGHPEGMPKIGTPILDSAQNKHTQNRHSAISDMGMPKISTPSRNAVIPDDNSAHVQNRHTQDSQGLKDNKDNVKNSLSPRAIVSGFYKGIGQSRISKAKRERAEKSLKELLEEGFNPEDVQFAVEWTLKNTKEELYDFSIIKHTIGQAMAAKKKVKAEEARKEEEERIAVERRADEKKREEEKAKIDSYKETLSSEERARLRERAEAEIRESGQYKAEFITEHLIEAKESELIREQINI